MNWAEIGLFSENLAKMLSDGIAFEKAFSIAAQPLRGRTNSRLAASLRKVFLDGRDLKQTLAPYNLPAFYTAMLECGRLTGNIPKSLRAGGHFLMQMAPAKRCLQKCWQFTFVALMIALVFKWMFLHRIDFVILVVLVIVFALPECSKKLRYYCDCLIVHIPFLGTWSKQSALMEFFVCMEIAYDSSLAVTEMFKNSISAIGNRYLRKQMNLSLGLIEQRDSFAAAMRAVPFIPRGIIAAVNTNEISGTLDRCFNDLAKLLKKVVEAKLEIVKFISMAVTIDAGILLPVLLIVPPLLPQSFVSIAVIAIASLMGYVPCACIYGAFRHYSEKSAEINLWFEHLYDQNHGS